MKSELQIFNNEEFGQLRVIEIGGRPYFVGIDIAKALGYSNASKAVIQHCKNIKKRTLEAPSQNGNVVKTETNLIPEGDIYRLIVKSQLPSAEKFEVWVFDNVLPTIRKTGGFVANTEMFVDTYFANLDEPTKQFLTVTLDDKKRLLEENNKLTKEIEYKEDIIINLVDDVDLATKRQRLQDIIKRNVPPKQIANRWNLLYKEFEKKYKINLARRLESEKTKEIKPKIKGKLDYIDRVLDKIPEAYELAAKIFENDVEKLKQEWFDVVSKDTIVH